MVAGIVIRLRVLRGSRRTEFAFLGVVGAFWGIGMLVRVLFFGLVVYLIVRLFRGRGWRGYRGYDDEPSHSELSAAEILRRRYAAGEITREQYEYWKERDDELMQYLMGFDREEYEKEHEVPEVIAYLKEAAQRNAERFSKL